MADKKVIVIGLDGATWDLMEPGQRKAYCQHSRN